MLGLRWLPRGTIYLALLMMIVENTASYHMQRHSRSPSVEVIMQLPHEFPDVDAFRRFLGLGPERRRRDTEEVSRRKRDTTAQENEAEAISRQQRESSPSAQAVDSSDSAATSGPQGEVDTSDTVFRTQRAALPLISTVVDSPMLTFDPSPYRQNFDFQGHPDAILALAQQEQPLKTEPDPADPRKRRNSSEDGHESNKRSFGETDTATRAPTWKQNKMGQPPPQFITGGREGRQKYDQLQHRSGETARESHSMKDGKSMATNEITRMGDSYYSPSNSATSRVYTTRPSDSPPPKSAYDTIDYTRRGQGRNADARGRLTQDGYVRSYDRYNGYYPLGAEIATRGVEYYHRSTDPGTGRIIYYASLPEPEAYRNTRTYNYDPYSRSFPTYPAFPNYPNYPYPQYNSYQPGFQPGYQPYSSLEFSRNARYQPLRSAYDDPRNKTYVIYDADDRRSLGTTAVSPTSPYENRYTPPLPYPGFAAPVNYQGYQPFPAFTPGYNGYTPYSSSSRRSGYPEQRSLVTREVDLPLSTKAKLKPAST